METGGHLKSHCSIIIIIIIAHYIDGSYKFE